MGANEEPCPMTAPLLRRDTDQGAARVIKTGLSAKEERISFRSNGARSKDRAAEKRKPASHRIPTWSAHRVEELKRLVTAGYSCRQIADEIGVTRNSVIGKMNRLGLSRPKDILPRPRETAERKRAPWRPKIITQLQLLMRLPPAPVPRPEDITIVDGRGCSLLELSPGKCRWPINEPGAENF
jgi:GcrA cell cycle regulator